MRNVLYYAAVFLLLTGTLFADISPINTNRPATIGVSGEMTLQAMLNSIYGPAVVDVTTGQQNDGMWQISGGNFGGTMPIIQFEQAGNSNSNEFGIWSEDVLGTLHEAVIFAGVAAPGAIATLTWGPSDSHTVTIATSGVSNMVSGIDRYAFGFYLNGPGGKFYTVDELNGGTAQALAYVSGKPDRWTLAFEDLKIGNGADGDYNDFVVTAESLQSVPEPAAIFLLGAMSLGCLPLRRYLRR